MFDLRKRRCRMGNSLEDFSLTEPEFYADSVIHGTGINFDLREIHSDLSYELFKECVIGAKNQLQGKNFFYDRNMIGAFWQAEITALLRERLYNQGWKKKAWAGGAYLTVSPCNTKMLIVETGTSDVGREKGYPTTRSRKGKKFQQAVRNLKLGLEKTAELWVLLIHQTSNNVQIELSLPRDVEAGRIVGYKQRILFPDVNFAIVEDSEITRNQQVPFEVEETIIERKQKTG